MTRKKVKIVKNEEPVKISRKRPYLKQVDIPSASLDEALRLPQSILDNYAGNPTLPLYVAKALEVDPRGSRLKVLSGAAIAFGLIEGGAQAAAISVTDLARRILRPKEEGTGLLAKREAVLKPRIFGEFLRSYDGSPFPRKDIALNVLEGMGVPREKAKEVLERIENSANSVGFLEEIKGKRYVSLQGTVTSVLQINGDDALPEAELDEDTIKPSISRMLPLSPTPTPKPIISVEGIRDDERRRRVYLTHGKNRDLVDPIKKLLEYGELTPVVSVERQSVSKGVPEKVMDEMRSCGAAIIHVDVDRTVTDGEGNDHFILNPNVLIEIGAAMALYGKRFVLLVQNSVKLPSNLQGLFKVLYSGDTLDANATIKLLEAIKDLKNHALPTDQQITV